MRVAIRIGKDETDEALRSRIITITGPFNIEIDDGSGEVFEQGYGPETKAYLNYTSEHNLITIKNKNMIRSIYADDLMVWRNES